MSLKGVSSRLSTDGRPSIQLVKDEKVLETLPILKSSAEHKNFILSTWVKSYEAAARKQGIREFYVSNEPTVAESLWTACSVVSDDSGYTVHAWVCATEGNLYHCYVVPELRKLRLATRLIEYSCPEGLKAYARPWPYQAHARVNPYLLGKVKK